MRLCSTIVGVVLVVLFVFVATSLLWRVLAPEPARSMWINVLVPGVAAATAACAWVVWISGRRLP